MAKKLRTYVSVQNPEGGDYESFGPDDKLPPWAQRAITNPGAWEDGEAPTFEPERPAGNGSKEDWAAFAQTLGATEDDLKGLNRDAIKDLVDLHDGGFRKTA